MNIRPVKAKKVHEAIEEQIMELIVSGELKKGDKLPSERELVELLQASRSSVREALRSLATLGYLEIRSGEGVYVKKADLEDVARARGMLLTLDSDSLRQVYEVRRILEVGSVELAVQRATDADIARMSHIVDDMRRSYNDVFNGDEFDIAFHEAIVEAAHNPALSEMMDLVSDSIHQVVKAARESIYLSYPRFGKLFRQHMAIYEAIKTRDAQRAMAEMKTHLLYSEELFTR